MDAAHKELEVKPPATIIPSSQTLDYKRLFRKDAAYLAAGVLMAIAVLRFPPPPFLAAESPTQSDNVSVVLEEYPLTHPNLEESEAEQTKVEQELLKTSIIEELKRFKEDKKAINFTLSMKDPLKDIVKDPRLNIPEADREFWVNTMLEILFVESKGKEDANSGLALGITQLKPSTIQEILAQYRIPKYDPYNGWESTFVGLAHQLNMAKLYGKELAPWVHHIGMGNINQALITYFVSVLKLPISEVDAIFTDETNQLLPKYIERYHISPSRLLLSPAVTGKLKEINALNDDTQFYPARLKAAGQAMQLQETKA